VSLTDAVLEDSWKLLSPHIYTNIRCCLGIFRDYYEGNVKLFVVVSFGVLYSNYSGSACPKVGSVAFSGHHPNCNSLTGLMP
jgi:hypothetical protein